MTTLSRKLRRRAARKSGTAWPVRERPHRLERNGSAYYTLNPTNGWRRFSAKRLQAQAILRHMAETVAARKAR